MCSSDLVQFQPVESLLVETSYQGARGRDLATLFINVNQVPFEYALDGRNTQAKSVTDARM